MLHLKAIMHLSLLMLIVSDVTAAAAADVPAWAVQGIAMVETRSRLEADTESYSPIPGRLVIGGKWRYVDQRIGADGERGIWQMTQAAFNDDAQPGERFEDLSTNIALAERLLRRRLSRLYAKHRDWFVVAGLWNAGSTSRYGRLWRYAKRVHLASFKLNINQEGP